MAAPLESTGLPASPETGKRWLPSIKTLLLCLAVLPPLLTGSILLLLANRSLARVSENMARAQVDEITAATEAECRRYFERAVRLSNIMTDITRIGQVSVTDMNAWKPRLFANMRAVPEVSTIVYINPEGHGVFISGGGGEFEFGTGTRSEPGRLDVVSYPATLDGTVDYTKPRQMKYDLKSRVWHRAAQAADGPVWTSPYLAVQTSAFGGRRGLAVAYARRIVSVDGRPLGELAVIQRFSAVNEFLAERAKQLDGYLLLYSEGIILGTSLPHRDGTGMLVEPERPGDDPERLTDLAKDHHAIEQALLPLLLEEGEPQLRGSDQLANVVAAGRTYRARETDVQVREGPPWRLVVALPEPALLGAARAAQRGMLVAGAILVGLSALAGAVLATRLSRPLVGLSRFAGSIGAGDFEKRTSGRVETARELADLGTALDRMAQELRERVNLLAQRDAAEQATHAKTRLIAHVSHEFRTPLNAIIGYADLLREQSAHTGRAREAADAGNILTASEHLLSLVNDLLDLSAMEAGRLRLDVIDFPVARLFEDVAIASRPVVERNGNRLHLRVPDGNAHMTADPMRVRQILINLLSNAGRFTDSGEVTLSAAVDSTGRTIEFVVADTGLGMSADQFARLFEPFAHLSSTQNVVSERAGAGLGLAITRQLCLLLGGDIRAETGSNGTRMYVTLPLGDATLQAGRAETRG